jgi:hypothetical protein
VPYLCRTFSHRGETLPAQSGNARRAPSSPSADRVLYASNNLDKARTIFTEAIKLSATDQADHSAEGAGASTMAGSAPIRRSTGFIRRSTGFIKAGGRIVGKTEFEKRSYWFSKLISKLRRTAHPPRLHAQTDCKAAARRRAERQR